MNRTCIHSLLFLPLIGAFFSIAVPAQAQNEIVQNPEAVLLRNVWMVQGQPGDRVGEGVGSVGDIDGDSVGDFAWYSRLTHQWYVHLGGENISQKAYQVLDSLGTIAPHPVTGNFYGDGKMSVGFSGFFRVDSSGPRTKLFMRYRVLPVVDDTIAFHDGARFAPDQTWRTNLETTHTTAIASDLDQDGDDELIIVVPGIQFDQAVDKRAEVWIFEGGPNFQLDTPTVVLKDTEENYHTYYAAVGDLDGDSIPDILSSAQYTGTNFGEHPIKYKFWWGKNALHDLSTNPDRTLTLDGAESNANAKLTLIDCDGDHVQDILRLLNAAPLGVHLYRSAAGKNIRDRSLTVEDADGYFPGYTIFGNGGYINDSLRRFESIILLGSRMLFFSGGKNGPNYTYDGYYSAADDGLKSENVFAVGAVIENCTGKGWDCYLTGNSRWGDNDEGIVILLEGGSYIPTDDTTSGVEVLASNDHAEAFHTWPNPVIDELHIAWRGDLKRSPSLMVVYDIQGREITSGAVEAWRGEALWLCGSVRAGTYLLAIYDKSGELLATTRVVKQ